MLIISALSPNLAAIEGGFIALSKYQRRLLAQLPQPGAALIGNKRMVSIRDLGALTAACGDEFAIFTLKSQRLLVRGIRSRILLSEAELRNLAQQGYRFSGHSHPRVNGQGDLFSVNPSSDDRDVLKSIFVNQIRSVIIDSGGNRNVFGTATGSDILIIPEG